MMTDIDKSLETSGEIIKNSIQKKFTPLDFFFGELKEIIPEELDIAVYNYTGRIIYKNGFEEKIYIEQSKREKILNMEIVFLTIENKRVIVYPYEFFGKTNVLMLGKNIRNVKKTINSIILIYFVIMVLIFGVSLFSTTLVIKNIMKALVSITSVANKIEQDNLSHRIEERYQTKEIDNLIDTLNKMLDRMEESFSRIKQFTYDVSHELKTPLTSIKNMLEVELGKSRTVIEYEETMQDTLEEINWIISIINELLLMNRMDFGRDSLDFETIEMKEIILEVVDLMRLTAEARGIEIIIDDLEEAQIKGEKSKLKRVILNIVSNGIKYNKENGTLEIKTIENEDEYGFSFRDTGVGIKEENISKIFERFYREDKVRTSKKSGAGLGLSIVDFIVEIHNGRIEVFSKEAIGTEIVVYFNKIGKATI